METHSKLDFLTVRRSLVGKLISCPATEPPCWSCRVTAMGAALRLSLLLPYLLLRKRAFSS